MTLSSDEVLTRSVAFGYSLPYTALKVVDRLFDTIQFFLGYAWIVVEHVPSKAQRFPGCRQRPKLRIGIAILHLQLATGPAASGREAPRPGLPEDCKEARVAAILTAASS